MRIAQRPGVHRDGAGKWFPNLSPWQIELRRRLWHHLVLLDTWCTSNRGMQSAISPSFADTLLPQNNDDTVWDVTDESSSCPSPESGCTDMSLALVQFEAAALLRTVYKHSGCYSGSDLDAIEFNNPLRRRTWDAIQRTYLANLDASDPEQALTLDFAAFTFERVRFTQFIATAWSNCCPLTPCGLKHR